MSDPPRRPALTTGAILSSLAQVGAAASFGLVGLVVARLLGPSETGAFSLVLAALNLLISLSTIGIALGITYHVGGGRWPLPEAFRQVAVTALPLGAAGAAVGIGLLLLGHHGFAEGVPIGPGIAALGCIPFGVLWTFGWSLALGAERYRAYAVALFGQALLALLLVSVLGATLGLEGAIVGLGASYAVASLVPLVWGARSVERAAPQWLRDAGARLRTAVSFGSRAYVANAVYYLTLRADLFILNAYHPGARVGQYAIALSVTELGLLLPRSLSTVLLPRVAGLAAESSTSERPVMEKAARQAVLLAAGSCVGLALLLLAVPLIYGSDFGHTTVLGLLLLPGAASLGVGNVLASITAGRGHPEYGMYVALISTPVAVAAYLLMIPPLGATGAAIASSGAYALVAVLTFVFFRRVTGVRGARSLLPGAEELRDYAALARRARRARGTAAGLD